MFASAALNVTQPQIEDLGWNAINNIAKNGVLEIEAQTVVKVADLLRDVRLTNGYYVRVVDMTDGGVFVCSFGPALLSIAIDEIIRSMLEHNDAALALYDLAVSKNLQVSFSTNNDDTPTIRVLNMPGDFPSGRNGR